MIKLKKIQFYKLFQIKKIVIKRTWTKSEKKNWRVVLKTWSVRSINWRERKKSNEKKKQKNHWH